MGVDTAQALKTAGAARVLLAGRPKDLVDPLRAAGVDDFLYAGCDMLATLGRLHRDLGISRAP
jgi:methylmalonyl-CoA mutase